MYKIFDLKKSEVTKMEDFIYVALKRRTKTNPRYPKILYLKKLNEDYFLDFLNSLHRPDWAIPNAQIILLRFETFGALTVNCNIKHYISPTNRLLHV